ncbi:hypothetical protein T10_415 [Trichinella papuae]|uniref:Uncharacterized protein n=1 Tax=Trichinella papuae TaxID=268474 RepID=A0A0V1MN52_9BILA|nr:hypothetical protein T10_415 [Trichinella papuae]
MNEMVTTLQFPTLIQKVLMLLFKISFEAEVLLDYRLNFRKIHFHCNSTRFNFNFLRTNNFLLVKVKMLNDTKGRL